MFQRILIASTTIARALGETDAFCAMAQPWPGYPGYPGWTAPASAESVTTVATTAAAATNTIINSSFNNGLDTAGAAKTSQLQRPEEEVDNFQMTRAVKGGGFPYLWESPRFHSLRAFRSMCARRERQPKLPAKRTMQTNNSNNKSKSGHQAMTRLAVAVIATLALNVQVIIPALAQSADSYLPPEVTPLDPQVASQLAQAQAKARAMNVSGDAIGDPSNSGANAAGAMNSRTMRQDMMQSLASPNSGAQFGNTNNMPAGNTNNMPAGNMGNAQAAPATTGTSDWIMPAKQGGQAGIATNYGNVEQTQTLSGQTQQQAVRQNTRRGGPSNAISGMAGFLGGAILGSALRRPGSLMGMGMYPFMMGGFGPTSAFRY